MTKVRVLYGVLVLAGVVLVPLAIMAFGPATRDDGLRWFNEEFWVTLFITFFSVAVTIGATVWISWLLLDRQLDAQRDSDKRARDRQLADMREQFERSARVRAGGGLRLAARKFALTWSDQLRDMDKDVTWVEYFRASSDLRNLNEALGEYSWELLEIPGMEGVLDTAGMNWTTWQLYGRYVLDRDAPDKNAFWHQWKDLADRQIESLLFLSSGLNEWELNGAFPEELYLSLVQIQKDIFEFHDDVQIPVTSEKWRTDRE